MIVLFIVKFRINRTPCAGSVGMQSAFGRVRRKSRISRIAKYVPQANSLCYKGYMPTDYAIGDTCHRLTAYATRDICQLTVYAIGDTCHRLTAYATTDICHKLTVYATRDTCHRLTAYATGAHFILIARQKLYTPLIGTT